MQKSDPANRRLIDALQNEDVEFDHERRLRDCLDVNQPLPFRGILSLRGGSATSFSDAMGSTEDDRGAYAHGRGRQLAMDISARDQIRRCRAAGAGLSARC